MPKLLLLELNEIHFDYVRHYAERGLLPEFSRLIDTYGVAETTSETDDQALEPWIQWVTAHTGLEFAEHGVFRLGDIRDHDLLQIWECLEAQGVSVGALSPMNASNRCQDTAFFVPDPWTGGKITAPLLLRNLHGAVAQTVADNARARITPASAARLAAGAARYARPVNYARYLALAAASTRGRRWARALFLDLLLTDVFIGETRRTRPDFASLFLNAGAHVQHHYLFNSSAYAGEQVNPEWYVPPGVDPVLDAYRLYDRVVGQIRRAFPRARLMIATGLHQQPHGEVTFYWRLKDHAAWLSRHGVPFERVEPRMSRDFLVVCRDREQAGDAERLLTSAAAADGLPLFEVDNRGCDLFVTLTYSRDVAGDFQYAIGDKSASGFADDIAFVAIKNGRHHGAGYFLDTGGGGVLTGFSLSELPHRVCAALGVTWTSAAPAPGSPP